MSTLGYKIGLFDSMCRHDLFPYNSRRAEWDIKIWAIKMYPALITLEIPDNAIVSTPEVRYNILQYNQFKGLSARVEFLRELQNYNVLFPLSDDDLLYHLKNKILVFETLGNDPTNRNFIDDRIDALKCRCNKAKVADIRLLEKDGYLTECYTKHQNTCVDPNVITKYRRNKFVYPDDFDSNTLTVCGNGIHYFEDPRLAILYAFNFYGLEIVSLMDYEYVINTYFNKED